MTEEINEDNCVLSKKEMIAINISAINSELNSTTLEAREERRRINHKILQKINKLNDMAKEKNEK